MKQPRICFALVLLYLYYYSLGKRGAALTHKGIAPRVPWSEKESRLQPALYINMNELFHVSWIYPNTWKNHQSTIFILCQFRSMRHLQLTL